MSRAGLLQLRGTAVTFTRTVQTHTESTDDVAPTTSSVSGSATRIPGLPKTYEALSLKVTEAITLAFVADTAGERPPLGSAVTWNGVKYRVKAVEPIETDGSQTAATVVIAK